MEKEGRGDKQKHQAPAQPFILVVAELSLHFSV